MQVPIQIEADGRNLLGILHVPPERAPGGPLIVLLYGLNGDRVDNHRLSVLLARRANAAGISVLRFDYGGSGVSGGEFHDTSIGTKVADAMAMVDFVKGCFHGEELKLLLLGYSDGVRVVHHVLRARRDIAAVALWNPILRSMTQTFRSRSTSKLAVEPTTKKLVFPLFGVYLGVDYLKEANGHLELSEILGSDIPKLFVLGTGDAHTRDVLTELRSLRRERADFDLHEIEGANHLFNRVAWSEELVATTIDWALGT